jgi:hypothetical protein
MLGGGEGFGEEAEWYSALLDRGVAEAAVVRDRSGKLGVVLRVEFQTDEATIFSPYDLSTRRCGTHEVACYRVHGPAPADPRFYEHVEGCGWRPLDVRCPAGCGRTVRVDHRAMPYASALHGSALRDSTLGQISLFDEHTCVCVRPDAEETAMECVSGAMVVGGALAALVLGLRPQRAARASFQPCMATLYVVFDGAGYHAESGSLQTRLVELSDGDDVVLNLGGGREGKLRVCQPASVVRVMDVMGVHVGLGPLEL